MAGKRKQMLRNIMNTLLNDAGTSRVFKAFNWCMQDAVDGHHILDTLQEYEGTSELPKAITRLYNKNAVELQMLFDWFRSKKVEEDLEAFLDQNDETEITDLQYVLESMPDELALAISPSFVRGSRLVRGRPGRVARNYRHEDDDDFSEPTRTRTVVEDENEGQYMVGALPRVREFELHHYVTSDEWRQRKEPTSISEVRELVEEHLNVLIRFGNCVGVQPGEVKAVPVCTIQQVLFRIVRDPVSLPNAALIFRKLFGSSVILTPRPTLSAMQQDTINRCRSLPKAGGPLA